MKHKGLEAFLIIVLAAMLFTGPLCIKSQVFAAEDDPRFFIKKNSPIQFTEGETLDELREEAKTFPDYYDLRHVPVEGGGEVSYITPVKVQNPYGTCWGFSAIAAAESSLLSSGLAAEYGYDVNTLDLSEKQICYFANSKVEDPEDSQYGEGTWFRGLTKDQKKSYSYMYDTGGVTYMAISVFASGIGPVLEKVIDPETGELKETSWVYRGKRGEKAYWEAATMYDDQGQAVEDSYRDIPVWYSRKDDWSIPWEERYSQTFRLKDSIALPNPADYDENYDYKFNPDAIDAIKQQIVTYHRAVSINFCAENYIPGDDTTNKKYMSKKWAHYTNTQQHSNHSVTVVGYDDNYPAENFDSSTESGGRAQPEGDGAFLIKNSWGSELNEFPNNGHRHWGLLDGLDGVPYDPEARAKPGNKATGYFWISYYDRSLNDPETFIFDGVEEDNRCYVQQMDNMYAMNLLGQNVDNGMMANVFETEATARLKEFSVITASPGTTISYKIYLLGDGFTDPEDGMLIEEGQQSFEYGGCHIIELTAPRVLARGQKYSVVVKETDEENDNYVNYTADLADDGTVSLYCVAVVNEGESFYYNGKQWADLSDSRTRDEVTSDFSCYGYNLIVDNFPIKSWLEPVTCKDGDKDTVFNASLNIYNWVDSDPGIFEVRAGESKTLTAEFRGNLPDSVDPVFAWETADENILQITTSTPKKGKAVITGLKPGVTSLIIYAGDKNYKGDHPYADDYGIRVLTIKVNKNNVISAELEDPEFEGVYTGKAIEPHIVNVQAEDGSTDLTEGKDYTVSYADNINAGTAKVIVTGIGDYCGELTLAFGIKPAGNTLKATGKTAAAVYSDKARTLPLSQVIAFTDPGQGAKTYTKLSGSKGLAINKTTGQVTIEKGLAAGSYDMEVNIEAAGDNNHNKTSQKVAVKINITSAANTLQVKGRKATVKYGVVQKKDKTLPAAKVITLIDPGQGAKTYKKIKGTKKITIDKNGTVTIKKGLKAGTYKVKVNVIAAGNANYKAVSKEAVFKVQVKKGKKKAE